MQIINPNYSALNAAQTAAIALNTAHVAGNGSDHADVATNTSGVASNVTAIGLNTTHRGSDGSDHSLSHVQNSDTYLDEGETNEVTAADAADAVTKKHAIGGDTTLGTMTANLAMGGFEITGAGPIAGGLNVIAIGENTALSVEECLSSLCLVSGAYTVTLRAVSEVAEGANVTVFSTGTNTIKVDLHDDDRFVLDGTALTVAHMLDSAGAAGDYVTVVKDSAAGWTVIGRSGTWIDGDTS